VAQVFARHAAQTQRAHEAVGIEGARPEHLGEPARADAPIHLHLPQPVLGVDEAQGEMRVLERGGVDMRDAVAVAQHLDLSAQAGELDLAFGLRQRLPQVEVSPCASKANQQQ
jgi:hypothetical protein